MAVVSASSRGRGGGTWPSTKHARGGGIQASASGKENGAADGQGETLSELEMARSALDDLRDERDALAGELAAIRSEVAASRQILQPLCL